MMRPLIFLVLVGAAMGAYGCRGGSDKKAATMTAQATPAASKTSAATLAPSAQATREGGSTTTGAVNTPPPGLASATAFAAETAATDESPIAEPDTPTSVPSGGATPHPVETILPPEGAGVATGLTGEARCSDSQPPQPIAQLRWTPATPSGSAQRVDVTIFSFDGSKYDSSDVLGPDQSSLGWTRVSGRAIHSWRVLTQTADGWVSSDVATFTGVTCSPL